MPPLKDRKLRYSKRLEQRIRLEHLADVAEKSIDLSSIEKHGLCSRCRMLSKERFTVDTWGMHASFVHHKSILSLQQSTRRGCPFCMFLWKQLGISSASQYPACEVLIHGIGTDDCPIYQVMIHGVNDSNYSAGYACMAVFSMDLNPFDQTSTLIPLSGDTSSNTTMQQVKQWIEDCEANHPGCLVDCGEAFIPTRLLDHMIFYHDKLNTLHSATDGTIKFKKTSTTRLNAAFRQEYFNATTLPQCFKDAFEVTIHLGLKYIWIDSLCILQDSPADWELEASLMSRIYRNAHCTISASLRCDESAGLFRKFSTENDMVSFTLVDEVSCHRSWGDWEGLIASAPLHTRGWCFQERQLSPRVVYWTEEQVVWECRGRTATEHSPWKQPKFKPWSGLHRTFNRITETPAAGLFKIWHRTVEQYTIRELSYSEDQFPALGGLARIINERLESAYVAGLWLANLAGDLLWYRSNVTSATRFETYIAPSWSWASLNGEIFFVSAESTVLIASDSKTCPQDSKLAVITDCTIDLSTSDPYGALSSGALHIETPLVTCHLDKAHIDLGEVALRKTPTEKRAIGYLMLDFPNETQQLDLVKCIALRPGQRTFSRESEELNIYYGIALVPVKDSTNTYRRVGYVSELETGVFAGVEIEDIIVI